MSNDVNKGPAAGKKLPYKRGFKVVTKQRMALDDKGYTQVEDYESYEEMTKEELANTASKKKS